jgi:hypothetical protein
VTRTILVPYDISGRFWWVILQIDVADSDVRIQTLEKKRDT